MGIDLKNDNNKAKSKINAFKTTVETQENARFLSKLRNGDNFEESNDKTSKQLNNLGDKKQRLQDSTKNQYEELIELFKISSIGSKSSSNSNGIDFLLKQVLGAAQNTKSRVNEIFVDTLLNVIGCSQEQTFDGNNIGSDFNKIYIKVNQIDLYKLLNKDPNARPNDLLYEKEDVNNGSHPYPMDKELYNRLQNEGISFYDEYGQNYIGGSGYPIMDVKYVTSYTQGGTTFNGDFLEVSLSNRVTGNSISDFLRDYYQSIDLISFDDFSVKLVNLLTNSIDIETKITKTEKEDKGKFEKILDRILGLCFDSNEEIDVSGNAKQSVLDNLDESFFEMSSIDLKNINNNINNTLDGVTEFEDCGKVRFPVNTKQSVTFLENIRFISDNRKVDALSDFAEEIAKDENLKNLVPTGINLKLSIQNNMLKLIPKGVAMCMLSPKVLLGMAIVTKSVGSTAMDEVEDFNTFSKNMKGFLVNFVSKLGAIFVEELFSLLKKNIRQLVEVLLIEIIKESKNAQVQMISSIISNLINLAALSVDWRKCKSVVDELLKLLSLSISTGFSRLPTFALAGSGILGGYSNTRALSNIIEEYQNLGLPTGDMPDGSPNRFIPAVASMLKGQRDEQLANSKTEIFIPPLAVAALGAGTTLPGRGWGKTF
jgi:hypothetical protein